MAGKDIIMATQEELKALHVIRKAIDKVVTQKEAAEAVDLSERQIRRKVKRVREEDDKGIIHKSRGRLSNRAKPDKIKQKALTLFKTKYPDFGPTLASEKLFERDKIKINDETLRLWLIKANIPYRKRKKRPHRQWRERKHCYGQMVQILKVKVNSIAIAGLFSIAKTMDLVPTTTSFFNVFSPVTGTVYLNSC